VQTITNWSFWEKQFVRFLDQQRHASDVAHDVAHTLRVVATAKRLAKVERARLEIVVPAAWLHDCVVAAKDSDRRSTASASAARKAVSFLEEVEYPEKYLPAIRHAIEAHSFSANIRPETVEAKVVQDADRLDALGAIGIARCMMVGGQLQRPLYHLEEPFPQERAPDDGRYTLDHFYAKLLKLAHTMHTAAGKAEAQRRTQFMRTFLRQLETEIVDSI
jgi:uncharacterized protein